jgi:hypothetical protein
MIDSQAAAKYVSELMIEINGRLIESINTIDQSCSAEESALYKSRVGKIVNAIFEAILEPIYLKHPELKAPGLD